MVRGKIDEAIRLNYKFDTQNYKQNVQELRAGTALENPVFIQFMRERALHDFGIESAYIVDLTLFPAEKIQENKNVGNKTMPYSKHLVGVLNDDIIKQNKAITGDETPDIDLNGNPLGMRASLQKEYAKQNALQDSVLKMIEMERPSAHYFTHEDKPQTVIVPQMGNYSTHFTLSERTGWNEEDFKFVNINNSNDDLTTADHEVGHAILNEHLQGKRPLENLDNEDYSIHIHECVADTVAAFSAIHDGQTKDVFDILSLERAYGGLVHKDAAHFTCATLQHLKETVSTEEIQNLESKKDVAALALQHVLGDAEKGIKPAFLSESAFEKQSEIIHGLHERLKVAVNEKNLPIPTPLQFEEMIKEGLFQEEDIAFLNRYVTHHKDTIVHKHDVILGLDTNERFHEAGLAHDDDTFYDIAFEEDISEFEEALRDEIFPVNEEGYIIHLPLEERLHMLKTYERSLGEMTEEEQAILHKYKQHIDEELEYQSDRQQFNEREVSPHYVEPEHDETERGLL